MKYGLTSEYRNIPIFDQKYKIKPQSSQQNQSQK
jgi:hypothetical protein